MWLAKQKETKFLLAEATSTRFFQASSKIRHFQDLYLREIVLDFSNPWELTYELSGNSYAYRKNFISNLKSAISLRRAALGYLRDENSL